MRMLRIVLAFCLSCAVVSAAEQRGELVIKSMDNATTLARLNSGLRFYSWLTPGFVKNAGDGQLLYGQTLELEDLEILLSATPPVAYDPANGTISMPQAGSASDGYLSSVDWATFNAKLGAVPDPIVPTDGTQNVTGNLDVSGYSEAGNIRLDTNTISTLNANGNLLIVPNGTGKVGIGGASSPDSLFQVDSAVATSTAVGQLKVRTTASNVNPLPFRVDTRTGAGDEGTPTLTGAETALFKRNPTSAYSAAIAILAGSAGMSQIYLGDKDDIDVGIISYNHNGNTLRLTVGASADRLTLDASGNVNIAGAYQLAASDRLSADADFTKLSAPAGDGIKLITNATGESLTVASGGAISHSTTSLAPITSTVVEASANGAVADFFRDSSSPAAGDLLYGLKFSGRSSTGVAIPYVMLVPEIVDPLNTSYDSKLTLKTITNSTGIDALVLEPLKAVLGSGVELYMATTKVIDSAGAWVGAAIGAASGGTGQTSYTKGDILVATDSTTLAKLTVGSDTHVLQADSGAASGVKWAAAPSAPAAYINSTTTTVSNTADDVETVLYSYAIGGRLVAVGSAQGLVNARLRISVDGTAGVELVDIDPIVTTCKWTFEAEAVGLKVWYRFKMYDNTIKGDPPIYLEEDWVTYTGTTHSFYIRGTGSSLNDVTLDMATQR